MMISCGTILLAPRKSRFLSRISDSRISYHSASSWSRISSPLVSRISTPCLSVSKTGSRISSPSAGMFVSRYTGIPTKNPNHLKVEYVGPRSCVQSPKGPDDIDADAAEVLMEQLPPKTIYFISSLLCTATALNSMPKFLVAMKMTKDLCIGEVVDFFTPLTCNAISSIYSVVCVAILLKSMPRFLMVMKTAKPVGLWEGDISLYILLVFVVQICLYKRFEVFIVPFKSLEESVTRTFLRLKPYYGKMKHYYDKMPDTMKASLDRVFFAGVCILIKYLVPRLSFHNMVKEGDYIQGNSVEGKVTKVGLLRTQLLDSKNKLVIVCNSEFETQGVMTISSFQYHKVTITLTLTQYTIERVRGMKSVIRKVMTDYIAFLENKVSQVLVPIIDDKVVTITVRYGIRDIDWREVADVNNDIMLSLNEALRKICRVGEKIKITQELG